MSNSKLLVTLYKLPKTVIFNRQLHNNEPPDCPPCPKPDEPQPTLVRAKTCEKCSFWQMQEDVCNGVYEPKPYKPTKAKAWSHKCAPMCNLCDPPKPKCNEVNINQCKDIPDCPKPNWTCPKT